jgi:hypothetical protein
MYLLRAKCVNYPGGGLVYFHMCKEVKPYIKKEENIIGGMSGPHGMVWPFDHLLSGRGALSRLLHGLNTTPVTHVCK